jgi:hypothetical protein
VIAALVGAAALLLLGAGAAKVAEPTRTAGALAALGWPASPSVVRAGAAAETVLGAATLIIGGRVLAAAVAVSYAGFAVFMIVALRSGVPVGTCGCFGRPDTPPRTHHAVIDGMLALAAAVATVVGVESILDAGAVAAATAVGLAVMAYVALTHRPSVSGADISA